MEKKEMLYEGKAKKVYTTEDPDVLIVSYKDDATAFNGLKKGTIVGKGAINNRMTNFIFKKLEEKGVRFGYVTLHVGLGTFRPVSVEKIEEHIMHSEHYEMPKETADLILETKAKGGRVIAVGTTSCRTLESVAKKEGCIKESEGWTDIFIYPGYQFQVLDGLITNFHLPESTLIMLVCALAGYQHTMHAYEVAVKEKYRFFSFGDAMLIQ